mmetsp:Transcript_21040/g.39496  ORF Transcript_21040/g.39496 Transcript_21040/m.39496 type:complete len:109 (-) Transcript_21040:977-1303(-)
MTMHDYEDDDDDDDDDDDESSPSDSTSSGSTMFQAPKSCTRDRFRSNDTYAINLYIPDTVSSCTMNMSLEIHSPQPTQVPGMASTIMQTRNLSKIVVHLRRNAYHLGK